MLGHAVARRLLMPNFDELKTEVFAKGAVIFEKGDAATCAYLIQSGIVVIVAKRGGQETVLDTLVRGDFFSEMALVDDEPRSATAIAGEAVSCAVISQDEINESLAGADLLTYALVRLLTKRLRRTAERGA